MSAIGRLIGFERLPALRWTRSRRLPVDQHRTTLAPRKGKRLVFSFANISRSYTLVHKEMYSRMSKFSSSRLNNHIPVALPEDGVFSIRFDMPVVKELSSEEEIMEAEEEPKKQRKRRGGGGKKARKAKKLSPMKKAKDPSTSNSKYTPPPKPKSDYLYLVFSYRNLYLTGFVYHKVYYKLKGITHTESDIGGKSKGGGKSRGKNKIDDEIARSVGATKCQVLPFGESYKSLGVSFMSDIAAGGTALEDMVTSLCKVENYLRGKQHLLKKALGTAVVMFSEAARFPKLQQFIAFGMEKSGGIDNVDIPCDEAKVHFHRWDYYSKVIRGDLEFHPSALFPTMQSLIDFLGVLTQSAP